ITCEYFALTIISVILIIKIHKASSIKTVMKSSNFYTKAYIKRAIELGLIAENQFNKVYRELDPEQSIIID
ncbi:MAG: hypothetical protein K2G14_05750, partial [Ruminococcus sp.]|nr:hypothetical protein [Ruminococcus sp.]